MENHVLALDNPNVVKIAIVRDGENVGILRFNPKDVDFVDALYALIREYGERGKEFERRAKLADENNAVDEFGIPTNFSERIALMREFCEYMREKIDGLFGSGTSKMVFGDGNDVGVFKPFFDGIMPFIANERRAKVEAYTNRRPKRKRK